VSCGRHCERSEAIHASVRVVALDCFAIARCLRRASFRNALWLAMTAFGQVFLFIQVAIHLLAASMASGSLMSMIALQPPSAAIRRIVIDKSDAASPKMSAIG
jgi:hypothetical protein